MGVLLVDAFGGVNKQHRDVRRFDRPQGLDDRKTLDRLAALAAFAQTRGVDQRVLSALALEWHLDRIARRARLGGRDHAHLAHQRVDQRRLADVLATNDGDARMAHPRRVDLGCGRLGDRREHGLEQIGHALAVRGGDRDRRTEAEGVEFRACDLRRQPLGLVRRDTDALRGPPELIGDRAIEGRQASARIDHEHHRIGFGDRLLGLARHFPDDTRVGAGLQATGIDDDKGTRPDSAVAVVPIARDAGHVDDDGIARSRQAVKQRGLTDVRSADECNNRFHGDCRLVRRRSGAACGAPRAARLRAIARTARRYGSGRGNRSAGGSAPRARRRRRSRCARRTPRNRAP